MKFRMKIIIISAIWCPGCLVMRKVWNNIKRDYPQVELIELDYDMDNTKVMEYNPGSILPVAIFKSKDDLELERIVGECHEDTIKGVILKYES